MPDWCPRCYKTQMGAGSSCSYCGLQIGCLTPATRWNGQSTDDLLIVTPDSFGDIFERSRHLNVLTEKGIGWNLFIDERATSVLRLALPRGRFTLGSEELPSFEYWTDLMDGLKTFSLGRPAPATFRIPEEWRNRFNFPKPSVGLCFLAAGRNNTLGCRFIEPRGIESIIRSISVNWVCLQQGKSLPPPVFNLQIETWEDTAAIIENLDAVVSVDTSVAHFCAIMKKPCVILHGTAETSVTNYLNFPEYYPGLPYKEFRPTYGGFEGGQPAWKKFIEWANKTPNWWNTING